MFLLMQGCCWLHWSLNVERMSCWQFDNLVGGVRTIRSNRFKFFFYNNNIIFFFDIYINYTCDTYSSVCGKQKGIF